MWRYKYRIPNVFSMSDRDSERAAVAHPGWSSVSILSEEFGPRASAHDDPGAFAAERRNFTVIEHKHRYGVEVRRRCDQVRCLLSRSRLSQLVISS